MNLQRDTRDSELSACVRKMMKQYFKDLDGEDVTNIYDMVVANIERPLLEVVLHHAEGNQTRAAGGRVIPVGTTALRLIESAADAGGRVQPFSGVTEIFIYPGYRFRVTDALMTNFHLPKSTLLMLVSAFAGYDAIRAAYAHAVAERYRFFSYGDAMLLERA